MDQGPPVAATTDVTRTMSETDEPGDPAGVAEGRRISTAAEEARGHHQGQRQQGVLRPGMTGSGRSGATTSTSAPAGQPAPGQGAQEPILI